MITKNIFKFITIHPFFYFVTLLTIITGNFKNFVSFISIILFHELGHILIGLLFKWKLEKVIILPFGGLTVFNDCINKPLLEEFLICLAGPIFQIIYYLVVSQFFNITNIHYGLLFFNLLPIVPLDGSKILNLLLNKILSFHHSYVLTNIVSFCISSFVLFTIIIHKWNLVLFLTIFLLIFKTLKEAKNTSYIFNKFLLERYVKNLELNKIKQIKGLNLKKMCRDYKHIFIYNKNYYTEREIIRKRFDLQGKVW